MRRWIVYVAAGISALQLSTTTQAQDLSLLYRVLGSETETRCWARTYDAQHLKRHSKQRVVEIRIDSLPRAASNQVDIPKSASALERYQAVKDTWIDIRLRSPGDRASKGVYCGVSADKRRLTCSLESDGGSFTITPMANGRLRINAGDRMQFETERRFLDLTKSDDRTFDLLALPTSLCRVPQG